MTQDGRAVIGITPAFDEGIKLAASKSTVYLRREYTKVLSQLGAIPVVLTPDMPLGYIMELCDGIVISGGEDIPPEVYDGDRLDTVQEPLERVMWEQLIVDACEAWRKPLLGVCYGMQLIALHYGGKLCQNIATDDPLTLNHVCTFHDVAIQKDFLGLKRGSTLSVASRHHQAVLELPDRFELAASARDGVIEAISCDNMYGVQWHPESDDSGLVVYQAFIERCGLGTNFTNRGGGDTILRYTK